MPVIVCENTDCKCISKRRTKFLDGDGCEVMCHTCVADIVDIRPLTMGDDSMVDCLGYQPYECTNNR
jgi:hypothetical protein